MHEYSMCLLVRAFEANEWIKGDLLKKFSFFEKPPVCDTYSEFFHRWMHEADAMQSQHARRDIFEELYAFAYVYSVIKLGDSEPDGRSWIGWITETLQIPYPQQHGNDHYDWLANGLQRVFKFEVPSSAHGRMFVSGIGRQSGFFIPDYAREYLKRAESELFRNRDWKALQDKVEIAKSKIPHNGNQADYQPVWDSWVALDDLRIHNALTLDHLDDVADVLDVVPAIAKKVLSVFADGDTERHVWIQPELHLSPNDDLLIRFPNSGVFPQVSAKSDVVVRVLSTTFRYRLDGDIWRLYGQQAAECGLRERSFLTISMLFKDGQNITEIDLTPEVFDGAVCLFNENGLPVRASGRLVAGDTYRVWKTSNWNDKLSFSIADDCLISPQAFKCPRVSELLLCDENESICQAFAVRDPSSLQIDFDQNDRLVPFVPGKRTYFELPLIEIKSVVGVDSVVLKCVETGWEFSVYEEHLRGNQLDLKRLFSNCSDYGRFELTVALGARIGNRSFSVLPSDFDSNLHDQIPVGEQGLIKFSSAELLEEYVVSVTSEQIDVDVTLEFNNGWRMPVKSIIARKGAFVRIGSRYLNLTDGCSPINVDDFYDCGEVVVYGEAGQGASLGFFHGHSEPKCIVGIFPKSGLLTFSLRNAHVALGGDFDYKYLTSCSGMSIRLASAMGGFARANLASVPLVQYAAKQPQVEWQEHDLELRHKMSPETFNQHPYIALLPVTRQDAEKIPVIAQPDADLPDWVEMYRADITWSIDSDDSDWKIAQISGLSDVLEDPGYILFVMCGNRRLSAGKYIAVPMSDESGLSDVELAFLQVFEEPQRLEQLFASDELDYIFIQRLVENAKRLNAAEFLLSISSFDWNDASGFIFRNYNYWLPMLLFAELNSNMTPYCSGQIEVFNQFWDISLFGYNETKQSLEAVDQLSDSLRQSTTSILLGMRVFWELLIGGGSSVGMLRQRVSICKNSIPGSPAGWEVTACHLHQWRKQPVLGKQPNQLRDELNSVRTLSPDWYSKIILRSIEYLLDDSAYLGELFKENVR